MGMFWMSDAKKKKKRAAAAELFKKLQSKLICATEADSQLPAKAKEREEKGLRMTDGDTKLCGFMDGKLPYGRCSVQRVKKRSLAPWKVWRRHWCAVRKLGPDHGLEILLDHGVGSQSASDKDNCIRIPPDAIICRTESRTKSYAFGIFPARERKPLIYLAANSEIETQKWMASLRQMLRPRKHRCLDSAHAVSMVDNAHSRSSGLTGLYGDLIASKSGVFIKDVHSGEIVQTFEWKEMGAIHLACTGTTEDVKQICVIHTTKEFRGGIGELHVYSPTAALLLKDLVTQGRSLRQNRQRLVQRPLSLSEGDLSSIVKKELADCPEQSVHTLKHKITINLVSAGLGLLLSSRSGSETKLLGEVTSNNGLLEKLSTKMTTTAIHRRAVDNVYQPEPAISLTNVMSSLEELEEPLLRRVSGISVASGIYEEIKDDYLPTKDRRVPSNLYENPGDVILDSTFKFQPPPLPPRQRTSSGSTKNESASDDGLDSEGGTRSTSPSTQEDFTPTPEDRTSSMSLDSSEYVPMSPRIKDMALIELQNQVQQENMYMVMR